MNMSPNPLLPAAIQTALVVGALGYTSAQSPLRKGILGLVAFCSWDCLNSSLEFCVRLPWTSLLAGYSGLLLFHYVDVGLLSGWEFNSTRTAISSINAHGKAPLKQKDTWWNRLSFGVWASSNMRCLGTADQVKNVPRFSNDDPDYVPSRAAFLRRTARIALLSYIGLDFLGSMNDPKVGNRFLVPSRVPIFSRLGEVTLEEAVVRSFSTFAMGLGLVCSQGGLYSIFGFASVLTGMSEPSEWPPFYGSPSDAYSLRRLWNRTWHQCNAHKLRRMSSYIVQNILRLNSEGLVDSYTHIVFVFLTSALMHYLIDLSIGLSLSTSGAVPFFCAQALGVLIEDLARYTYRSVGNVSPDQPITVGQKILGHIWVGAFLAWSLPAYVYPMLHRGNLGLNDSVIPVSIIGIFKNLFISAQ